MIFTSFGILTAFRAIFLLLFFNSAVSVLFLRFQKVNLLLCHLQINYVLSNAPNTIHLKLEFLIHIGLKMDPDPALKVNTDLDPASKVTTDPDQDFFLFTVFVTSCHLDFH